LSHRHDQLEADLQREVQAVISRGLSDPRVRGLITVTSVRLSQDGREATVLVSVLPAERQELTLHGLTSAAPHLRHALGVAIRARAIPALHFRADTSTKKQAGVLNALDRVRAERELKESACPPPPEGTPDAPSGEPSA